MKLYLYLILFNSLFFWVLFFLGQNFVFTFLSIQTFSVKYKFGFMINLKIQSKWYFSLWDLVKIWGFEKFKNGGVFMYGGNVMLLLVGEEEVDFFPPWPVGPTCFVSYAVYIAPFQICPPFVFLFFFFAFFFIFSIALIYLFFSFFFLLSISRNMQHYLMPFFYFFIFLYLVYFCVISFFSFFIYLLYLVFCYFLHFYLFTLFTYCFFSFYFIFRIIISSFIFFYYSFICFILV